MNLVKLLLIGSIISLLAGQLLRIPPSSQVGAITPTDILVVICDLVFLATALFNKTLKLNPQTAFAFTLFLLSAATSIILSLGQFSLNQVVISALFLFRFIIYFFLSIVVYNSIRKTEIKNWINFILSIGLIFIVIGFLQFILFPDLSFLTPYGWDPHQRRVVSTLLDPNFSGWIFTFVLSLSASFYLYLKKKAFLILAFLSFIAIILTFSRSSYLATIVVIFTIGILKSPKLLIAAIAAFLLTYLLIGQVRERVIGAFQIDETSKSRIESWQNALTVFKDNWAFGVGFNTYRYAQEKYGFFSTDNPQGGHSGSGTDSSILLVAATTGVFGLSLFLFLLASVFKILQKNITRNPLSLAVFASFLGLLIHSQFVNSLFFPQIMLLFWISAGLVLVNDS